MKTAEDEVSELSENLKMDQIVKSLLIRIIKSRDREIRKDQDKITRHACAESVIELDGYETPATGLYQSGCVCRDKAHLAIMNTNAFTED